MNYLKTAVRNLRSDKKFAMINIAGFAVGITCFLTLTLFILDELGFDRFYKNAGQVYRIYVKQHINGKEDNSPKTPGPLGQTLVESYPEVQTYTRIGYFGQYLFRYEDKVFNEFSIYGVDSTFFDVFNLSFIEGDPRTALTKPNSIVLTETSAKKYFGNESPVGKTLTVDKAYIIDYLNQGNNDSGAKEAFLVTGLIRDFPKNSHFSCQALTSLSTYHINQYWLDLWYSTYVVLKKGTDWSGFERKLETVVDNNVGPLAQGILGISLNEFFASGNQYSYRLQPLTSIYLHSQRSYGIVSNNEWGDIKSSDIAYIYIFSAVAAVILLIAIINFMNLATARSEKRSREVGIRKTLGSNKLRLVGQFISEAILMSGLSVLMALALLKIVLPLFNDLTGKSLQLELVNNFYSIPLLLAFTLLVGILAGSYPAFYLSSFRPVQVLKAASKGNRKSYLRSALVIVQFAISITLLISTVVIKNQFDYMQSKNLGFNKEHLYAIMNANVLGNHMETFKQELLKNPNVLSINVSSEMFRSGIPGSGYIYNKKIGADPIPFRYLETDYDFLTTYEVKMAKGRFFSKDFSTDSSAVVINEAAAKVFGDGDPVGKELTRLGREDWAKTFRIIGVIEDFNYESLHQQVHPLALHLGPVSQRTNYLTIRIASHNSKKTVGFIGETWKRFTPEGEGMFSRFVDETLARLYESERKTGIIATLFSSLAIFIACLGLFGLAIFIASQRIKEIGIRKVNGAKVWEVMTMLNKDFVKWVIIAFAVATPIAWYAMNKWLENFAYKTELSWWIFALTGLLALGIALLTVSWQSWKAATRNPVEALRYE